jgi:hypothetical protein
MRMGTALPVVLTTATAAAVAITGIGGRGSSPHAAAASPVSVAAGARRFLSPEAPAPDVGTRESRLVASDEGRLPPGDLGGPFFEDTDEDLLPADVDTDFDRTVYRQRFVSSDPQRLAGASELEWNLFDDTSLHLVLEELDWKADDGSKFTWRGRVEGDPHSQVVILVDGSTLTANVALSNGDLFAVDSPAPGVQRIQELNPSVFAECGQDPSVALAAPDEGGGAPPLTLPQAAGGSELIDVLLVYTPGARDSLGSTQLIENRLQLQVEWANAVYQNSGASQRLRAAAILEVDYDDSHHDGLTALEDLTYTGDAELEAIHALRDAYSADMVTLFTRPSNVCGIAWQPLDAGNIQWYEIYMFSVVVASCTSNPRTFTHELGHNQGAYHDPLTSQLQGMTPAQIDAVVLPNSFGYIAPGDAFHTVMAYGSSCSWCASLQQFSNPDLSWQGLPTGDARSDVRTTLQATHVTIAAFREPAACTGESDGDGDGVCDPLDDCVDVANPDQRDTDLDGYGNLCDADFDNDGVVGAPDYATVVGLFGQEASDPGYDPDVDLNGNGAIGGPEFSFVLSRFGEDVGPSGLACAGSAPCSAE